MFRGILFYLSQSVIRSRIMYAYIVTLLIGLAALYIISPHVPNMGGPGGANSLVFAARQALSTFSSAVVFFAVFIVSRRIPAMIGSGTAGFFLSKPLSRERLLSYTLISSISVNTLIAGLIIAMFGAGILLILPGRPVVWDITLQIGLELSVLVIYIPILFLLGLLTRSGSYAFMISFAIWMLAYILTGREGILAFIDSDLVRGLAEIVYYALPKSSEIVELAYPKVSSLQTGADWTPLWSSALTAAAAYGLGLLRFRRMDL